MKKTVKKRVACAVLTVALLCQLFVLFCVTAIAAGRTTDVLEDLQWDPNFSVVDYPQKANDYSITVIQIAEGIDGELFVYVYRPEGAKEEKHRATYINMSLQNPTAPKAKPTYNLYSLTWLNGSGALEKYQVNDFVVSSDTYRYYNIATVYRAFDASLDNEAEAADDVNNAIGFEVGICFCAYYYNDTLVYEAGKVDVVDIEILAVGSVRYSEGYKLFDYEKCDSHFVAFTVTNYDVDKIFDADVTYNATQYKWSYVTGALEATETYTDLGTDTVFLSHTDTASNKGDGWLGVQYTWNRIVTKSEFEQQLEDVKNEEVVFSKGDLGSAQFVFQFLETEYDSHHDDLLSTKEQVFVTDVGILRLHFLSEGKVYNLGAVSDLVSDDGVPDFTVTTLDNVENMVEGYLDWFEKIMAVVLIVLLIVVLWPFLNPVVSGIFGLIWSGIKLLFKVVWKVLTWPFKLIGRLLFPKK